MHNHASKVSVKKKLCIVIILRAVFRVIHILEFKNIGLPVLYIAKTLTMLFKKKNSLHFATTAFGKNCIYI